MGEKARVLRKKIQEGIENAQVAQITGAVIDELLRESLAQQVPERTRVGLKSVKPQSIGEAVMFVREEEEEERELQKSEYSEWRRVEPRRYPVERRKNRVNMPMHDYNKKPVSQFRISR
ncbi:hypothetical protein, partial [Klebsiella pneumoniae]|uniref:hypothetical protein n=1 Tax=Klebsiella pneumoniae TaxID=573 RepID=UPI0040554859